MHLPALTLKILQRKNSNGVKNQPKHLELTVASLENNFSMPLAKAALQLGVCETSL